MKKMLTAIVLACLASGAHAHEIWIERDGDGPARIYLGEPAEALPEGGDPEFAKLKAPKLLGAAAAAPARKAGYLEVAVAPGDTRAWDDNVFAPWGEDGAKEGIIYYARAGRSETRAAMPFEIVPAVSGGNRFVVSRDGSPVAGAAVTVVTPDKWSKKFVADANGAVELPLRESGRYLLSAAVEEEGNHNLPGGPVQKLHRITTITFVTP
jgi:hypothetical protein